MKTAPVVMLNLVRLKDRRLKAQSIPSSVYVFVGHRRLLRQVRSSSAVRVCALQV